MQLEKRKVNLTEDTVFIFKILKNRILNLYTHIHRSPAGLRQMLMRLWKSFAPVMSELGLSKYSDHENAYSTSASDSMIVE